MSRKPDLTHLTHLPYATQLGKLEGFETTSQDRVHRVDASNASKIADAAIGGSHTREPPIAVRELLGFDPRLIAGSDTEPGLLAATTLVCRQANGAGEWVVTTSRAAYAAARARKVPAFVGREIEPLVLAAENERASWHVLAQWCTRKTADPAWRLEREVALGGLLEHAVLPPQGWTLERVLRAYGAELVAVGCGDEVPT
jgi:hypothetical protein